MGNEFSGADEALTPSAKLRAAEPSQPRRFSDAERDERMAEAWERYKRGEALTLEEFKAKHGDR
jgi:uncharacterized coiled-coil DUF342 family protein